MDTSRYENEDPILALSSIQELLDGTWSDDPQPGDFIVEAFCYATAGLIDQGRKVDRRFIPSFEQLRLSMSGMMSFQFDPLSTLTHIAECLEGTWPADDISADNYLVDAYLVATGPLVHSGRISETSRLAEVRRTVLEAVSRPVAVWVGYAMAAGSGYELAVYDKEMQPLYVREFSNNPSSDDPADCVSSDRALSDDELLIEGTNAALALASEYGLERRAVFYDNDRARAIAEDRDFGVSTLGNEP